MPFEVIGQHHQQLSTRAWLCRYERRESVPAEALLVAKLPTAEAEVGATPALDAQESTLTFHKRIELVCCLNTLNIPGARLVMAALQPVKDAKRAREGATALLARHVEVA